jgi:Raf kinase inhibitor-like YbhB/YbcL family protein
MKLRSLLAPVAIAIAIGIAGALTGCATVSAPAAPGGTAFTLWSPQFADGSPLTPRHAGKMSSNPNCTGENLAPALAWKNVPPGTRSLAMLVHDQQGRAGLGVVHWIAYGIDPAAGGFAENEITQASPKYTGGKSTLGLPAYMGPCPPANTGQHAYVYTLIATDLERGALRPGLTMQEVMAQLEGRAKGASSIVLRYGRQ